MTVSALLVEAFAELDEDGWVQVAESGLLTYVEEIDPASHSAWLAHAPWVARVNSKAAKCAYLANTCKCGEFQGDWFLTEPDAPFFPTTPGGVAAIDVEWVDAPLQARARVSLSGWTDELIARCPPPPAAPSPA